MVKKIDKVLEKSFFHWNNNNLNEAKFYLNKALKLDPANSKILFYKGTIELQTENLLGGIEFLEKAYALNSNDIDIKINFSNALINYSNSLIQQNDLVQAESVLKNAVGVHSENETAYLNLLKLLLQNQNFSEIDNLLTSIKSNNFNNAEIYYILGNSYFDQKNYIEAIKYFDNALLINPNYKECIFHKALSNEFLGNFDEAMKLYDFCFSIDPNYDLALFNKALILLSKDNFKVGWDLYKYRWSSQKFRDKYLVTSKPKLLKENKNSKIFVWAEQGLGDQILFSSVINDFSKIYPNLIVSIDKRLIPLFSRSFPSFEFVDKDIYFPEEKYDYHIPLGDIPSFVRLEIKDFISQKTQFIYSDKATTNEFKKSLSVNKKPICGLSWTSKNNSYGNSKSIKLDELAIFLEKKDFNYINLEYIDSSEELSSVEKKYGFKINKVDSVDKFNDIDQLCSLISACDIVITISNVTAHLSGAMGVKTFLLAPYGYGRLWYWNDEGVSKWYPSVSIIRQTDQNQWLKTFEVLDREMKLIGF